MFKRLTLEQIAVRGLLAVMTMLAAMLAMAPQAMAADRYVTIIETIEEYDIEEDVGFDSGDSTDDTGRIDGAALADLGTPALASFGPFAVLDGGQRAALLGTTDSDSPAQFAAMMKAYPDVRRIDLVEVPGTVDDDANLALGRMIRKAGLATHVPDQGSVRSGGVELFLAGVERSAAPTAEFAVHSWRDEDGREAGDLPDSDPVHQAYLAYYRDMGLSADTARAFYKMTNETPHDQARYLNADALDDYVSLVKAPTATAPVTLAYAF